MELHMDSNAASQSPQLRCGYRLSWWECWLDLYYHSIAYSGFSRHRSLVSKQRVTWSDLHSIQWYTIDESECAS